MKDVGSDQSQDDFAVEITDLEAPGSVRKPSRSARIFSRFQLASRQHRRPFTMITASMVVLVVLLILASTASMRGLISNIFVHHLPPPTPIPTLYPGADLFYVDATPPWGRLFIDGGAIAHLPTNGVDPPLRLSRGQHVLTWRAEPFQEQQCTLSVPPNYDTDTCTYDETPNNNTIAFTVIFLNLLNTLPDDQQAALIEAVQQALDTQQSTDTVQPGELYVLSPHNPLCQFTAKTARCYAVAKQPLKATLRFQLDINSYSNETCINSEPGCTFLHRDCHLFCPGLPGTPAPGVWSVFVTALSLWTFAMMDGQILERDIPDNSLQDFTTGEKTDESLVEAHITWDSQGWHVVIPAGASMETANFLDPACAAAESSIQSLEPPADTNGNALYLQWQFASGAVPAVGCVARSNHSQQDVNSTAIPTIYCLHRFGVILTANDQAHRFWPYLPVADAHEEQLARQLAASL